MNLISEHTWGFNWLWGIPLIISNVFIHVIGLNFIRYMVFDIDSRVKRGRVARANTVVIASATALMLILLHTIEIITWAGAYYYLNALPDSKTSMLYSLGAMTTYGHAELFLKSRWQFLGAMEALDGVLLFGLTTAFMFAVFQSLGAFERRTHR